MTNDEICRQLKDKDEIQQVLINYCRAADTADEALMRAVFHPDATDEHAGMFGGNIQDIIPTMIESRKRLNFTQHSVSNVRIEIKGDTANTECYVSVVHAYQKEGQQYQWFCGGRYVDRLEHRNGEWRIAKRVSHMDWSRIVAVDPSLPMPL